MSLHDAYARLTPYELAFPGPEGARALTAAVTEESAGRGADPDEPHAFLTMGAVEAFARDLQGPDSAPGGVHRYGLLAYHAVHFCREACPLYVLSVHAARYLVEGVPGDHTTPPTAAGYLQLPQHLFWADGGAEAPESVDGVFWTGGARGVLQSLLVTGVRPDRPGLGVVPLPEAPVTDAASWLDFDARGDGTDFTTTLPGSEIDGLYEFRTAGEILKLLGRFFAYVAAVPDALVSGVQPPEVEKEGPPPSSLPYARVVLPD